MFALLAALSGEVLRIQAVSNRADRTVAVLLRSEGQATLLASDRANFSRDVLPPSVMNKVPDKLHGHCYSNADCKHADLCDLTGSFGCQNRCVFSDMKGNKTCQTQGLAEVCAKDGDCLSARCDTDNFYGCLNLCLSEEDEGGRHCRAKAMGEPCDNSRQCLLGVCDTQAFWGCRDLCVSELDSFGANRHCDPKQVSETCAHHENCELGHCDLNGTVEELDRCDHRCVASYAKECPRPHCSPNCPLCLSNLMLQEQGVGPNQWTAYPGHRAERNANTKAWRLWLREAEETQLQLRIPSSCIEQLPCVQVKGTLEVSKLSGARLHIQSGLFAGFPEPKPKVDTAVSGTCPMRPDGFPEVGNTGCCYSPESVEKCKSTPYNKGCASFLAGSVFFGADEWWGWEHRTYNDSESFDQTRAHHRFVHGDFKPHGMSRDFSVEVDFAAEQYKYFRFGGKSWNMDEPLMRFTKDRDCNHIHDWPQASFEFSIRLAPPAGHTGNIDAEIKLTHLEVNRKAKCSSSMKQG